MRSEEASDEGSSLDDFFSPSEAEKADDEHARDAGEGEGAE